MCGIAGLIGSGADADVVRRMTSLLRHRGPDDEGLWESPEAALGHTRLAILDLTAAAHQPMVHGDLVITYNGEIYNFRELRRELPGPFRTNSDTEVLLHLFERHGDRCVELLRGMFAFAIWDRSRRRLFAARDRLGIKPFFYRPTGRGLAFASELKSLLVPGTPPTDRGALRDYIIHGFVPTPKTAYSGINKLPPAHTLTWEDGTIRIDRYWSPAAEIRFREPGPALERLDELLATVVSEHTIADVPVGVFLSGGMDSAVLTSYLDKPKTFTLGMDVRRRSEADAARAVATHFGTEHRETTAQAIDLESALDAMPRLFDEPFADSAAWSAYLISEATRPHVTVALSGEGGDELFCGYPRYWTELRAAPRPLAATLARLLPPLSRIGISAQRNALAGFEGIATSLSGITPRQLQGLLRPQFLEAGYDHYWPYRAHWRDDLPPAQQMRWLELHTRLPDGLLTKVDRASMAHSLEVRPPLLDHRLVEFALSVDPDLLIEPRPGRGKVLLREMMRPRLPEGHVDLRKRGFGLPVRRWMRNNPDMLRAATERLTDAGILRRPVSARFRGVWRLLVLDRWMAHSG